jgi:exopolyphosphatase/pppGpp-phosphohydrolase
MSAESRAIVDLGSSTAKLYVASLTAGSVPSITAYEDFDSRLADTVASSGTITPHIVNHIIPKLQAWLNRVKIEHQISTLTVYGTGAFRKSTDSLQALRAINSLDGVRCVILSQDEEAHLIYQAIWFVYQTASHTIVVLNVGGSSTQLVAGDSILPSATELLPWGTRDLVRKHIMSDPLSEQDYLSLQSHISTALSQLKITRPEYRSAILFHTGGELEYLQLTNYPLAATIISDREYPAVELPRFVDFAETMRRLPLTEIRAMRPQNPAWMEGAVVCNTILIQLARIIRPRAIVPSNVNLAHALLIGAGK